MKYGILHSPKSPFRLAKHRKPVAVLNLLSLKEEDSCFVEDSFTQKTIQSQEPALSSPQANTEVPSASTLRAAFTSLSCSVPQSEHIHVLSDRLN